MRRPGPLRLILWLQFIAIPLALVAGFLAMIAATPFFSALVPSPWPFYATASFFTFAAPIVHGVLAFGLLIERAWAWQRALVLAWVLMVGETVFVIAGSIALEMTLFLWLSPLLAIGVATLVYLRDPRVEAHLGARA